MKSVAKMKYLHIGFKIVEAILEEVNRMENWQFAIVVVKSLLLKYSNFKSMLVRNVQMTKNQLHQVSSSVKKQLIITLDHLKSKSTDEDRSLFSDLLKSIFGPNTFTHFSPKKNNDLLGPICALLDDEQITSYIEHLQ
jgi:hypothetical protein